MCSNLVPEIARIEYKGKKFLFMESPCEDNIDTYIKIFQQSHCTILVRACQLPTYYTTTRFETRNIAVVDLSFEDGSYPSEEIIEKWLELVDRSLDQPIAVHCVAGLGRAPLLVAIAMIEYGCSYDVAINLIRKKKRGALNEQQILFLENYKPKSSRTFCRIL